MKVALVYDRVNKWGGAERVLLALHELFPDAPLYTAVYNKKTAKWAEIFQVVPSFLQNFPFAKQHHEFFAPLMPLAFESFSFDDYDVVISITSEAAKGIITKPSTKHICICLTPTRYLWSGYQEYFSNSFVAFLVRPLLTYLHMWDVIAARRPDIYIAISQEVKDRIKKFYLQESFLVYPYSPLADQLLSMEPKLGSYFLIVSRLSRFTQYKRVDIAIDAALKAHVPLKIIGGGSYSHLHSRKSQFVEFVGNVSDSELLEYYLGAKALIFAGVEDFGLTMVEAQAAGKPVIAYRGGGAQEIIREGISGEFFNHQTSSSLLEVLKKFDETAYNKQACKQNASRFSQQVFQKEITKLIQK